jgi:hypothetical protein
MLDKFMRALVALAAVGAVIALAVPSGQGAQTGKAAAQAAQGTAAALTAGRPAPATPAAVRPTPAPTTVGPGTWAVPAEVHPGTYITTAPAHCYWARLSSTDGELASIIANENLPPGARGRITIKKTDAAIKLDGPCIWQRIGAPIPPKAHR